MSLIGFRAQNHEQQVSARGAVNNVDDRETDDRAWGPWHERFGFTVDAAADHHNAKLPRYFTRESDGLTQSWAGERVWCNPPYSGIEPWICKAWHAVTEEGADLVVMLLPANRTEQRWWQDLVEPRRDLTGGGVLRVEFLRGRLRFLEPGEQQIRPNSRPPFGCCLLIFMPPAWTGPECFMCNGTGRDRSPVTEPHGTFERVVGHVENGLRCRACNGHGRQPSPSTTPP